MRALSLTQGVLLEPLSFAKSRVISTKIWRARSARSVIWRARITWEVHHLEADVHRSLP